MEDYSENCRSAYSPLHNRVIPSNEYPLFHNYQLIGDSQLVRFSEFFLNSKRQFYQNSSGRIGYCVGGQRAEQLSYLLENREWPLHTNVILLIGTNDINQNTKAGEWTQSIQRILTALVESSVRNLIILTVPPVPKIWHTLEHWVLFVEYNYILKNFQTKYKDSFSSLKLVDMNSICLSSSPPSSSFSNSLQLYVACPVQEGMDNYDEDFMMTGCASNQWKRNSKQSEEEMKDNSYLKQSISLFDAMNMRYKLMSCFAGNTNDGDVSINKDRFDLIGVTMNDVWNIKCNLLNINNAEYMHTLRHAFQNFLTHLNQDRHLLKRESTSISYRGSRDDSYVPNKMPRAEYSPVPSYEVNDLESSGVLSRSFDCSETVIQSVTKSSSITTSPPNSCLPVTIKQEISLESSHDETATRPPSRLKRKSPQSNNLWIELTCETSKTGVPAQEKSNVRPSVQFDPNTFGISVTLNNNHETEKKRVSTRLIPTQVVKQTLGISQRSTSKSSNDSSNDTHTHRTAKSDLKTCPEGKNSTSAPGKKRRDRSFRDVLNLIQTTLKSIKKENLSSPGLEAKTSSEEPQTRLSSRQNENSEKNTTNDFKSPDEFFDKKSSDSELNDADKSKRNEELSKYSARQWMNENRGCHEMSFIDKSTDSTHVDDDLECLGPVVPNNRRKVCVLPRGTNLKENPSVRYYPNNLSDIEIINMKNANTANVLAQFGSLEISKSGLNDQTFTNNLNSVVVEVPKEHSSPATRKVRYSSNNVFSLENDLEIGTPRVKYESENFTPLHFSPAVKFPALVDCDNWIPLEVSNLNINSIHNDMPSFAVKNTNDRSASNFLHDNAHSHTVASSIRDLVPEFGDVSPNNMKAFEFNNTNVFSTLYNMSNSVVQNGNNYRENLSNEPFTPSGELCNEIRREANQNIHTSDLSIRNNNQDIRTQYSIEAIENQNIPVHHYPNNLSTIENNAPRLGVACFALSTCGVFPNAEYSNTSTHVESPKIINTHRSLTVNQSPLFEGCHTNILHSNLTPRTVKHPSVGCLSNRTASNVPVPNEKYITQERKRKQSLEDFESYNSNVMTNDLKAREENNLIDGWLSHAMASQDKIPIPNNNYITEVSEVKVKTAQNRTHEVCNSSILSNNLTVREVNNCTIGCMPPENSRLKSDNDLSADSTSTRTPNTHSCHDNFTAIDGKNSSVHDYSTPEDRKPMSNEDPSDRNPSSCKSNARRLINNIYLDKIRKIVESNVTFSAQDHTKASSSNETTAHHDKTIARGDTKAYSSNETVAWKDIGTNILCSDEPTPSKMKISNLYPQKQNQLFLSNTKEVKSESTDQMKPHSGLPDLLEAAEESYEKGVDGVTNNRNLYLNETPDRNNYQTFYWGIEKDTKNTEGNTFETSNNFSTYHNVSGSFVATEYPDQFTNRETRRGIPNPKISSEALDSTILSSSSNEGVLPAMCSANLGPLSISDSRNAFEKSLNSDYARVPLEHPRKRLNTPSRLERDLETECSSSEKSRFGEVKTGKASVTGNLNSSEMENIFKNDSHETNAMRTPSRYRAPSVYGDAEEAPLLNIDYLTSVEKKDMEGKLSLNSKRRERKEPVRPYGLDWNFMNRANTIQLYQFMRAVCNYNSDHNASVLDERSFYMQTRDLRSPSNSDLESKFYTSMLGRYEFYKFIKYISLDYIVPKMFSPKLKRIMFTSRIDSRSNVDSYVVRNLDLSVFETHFTRLASTPLKKSPRVDLVHLNQKGFELLKDILSQTIAEIQENE